MRLSMVSQGARPTYIDRNQADKNATYSAGGVAPHVSTNRWSYTVPAGRKAYLEDFMCLLFHDAAATTAGAAYSYINYQPPGGVNVTLVQTWNYAVALASGNQLGFALQKACAAGGILTGVTADAGVGGTYTYLCTAAFSEFDQ